MYGHVCAVSESNLTHPHPHTHTHTQAGRHRPMPTPDRTMQANKHLLTVPCIYSLCPALPCPAACRPALCPAMPALHHASAATRSCTCCSHAPNHKEGPIKASYTLCSVWGHPSKASSNQRLLKSTPIWTMTHPSLANQPLNESAFTQPVHHPSIHAALVLALLSSL